MTTTGCGNKISRKQEAAIGALMTCSSIRAAAEQAGLDDSTLDRWLKLPEFQAAYREQRRAALDQTTARLSTAAAVALDTLVAVAADEEAGPAPRVAAAGKILDLACRLDTEARLAEVEELLAELKAQQPPTNGRAYAER